ncbi:MAG: beta-L-arabinofuranosidase domain-containing protein [Bryobacteraceae bacterium]|jgi:DUF1680 family protein
MQSRRQFAKSLAIVSGAAGLLRGSPTREEQAGRNVLESFNYSGVRLLDGALRKQFLAAREVFFNIPNDDLLKGFRARAGTPDPGHDMIGWYAGDRSVHYPSRWCYGDFYNAFGQYLSGMARISKAGQDSELLAKATRLMREWGKTVEQDGFFYYSRNPHTPHYVYEKTICGLVDLYEYGGVRDALPLLDKITDWATRNLDRSRRLPLQGVNWNANGQEWYTLPENLYRAYQLTGELKYKTFGDVWRYPHYWGMFGGDKTPGPYYYHAYSHVNTLNSAAMTYVVTGAPEYLNTIVKAYDWLEKTQMYATGGFGPGEEIMPPDGSLGRSLETEPRTFETVCGSWAGFKLGRYLIQLTGQARYGDWMERLLYNGIGAALWLQQDGTNFYYSDYSLGGGRKLYHREWKWTCCSGTYPQAIADYHNIIYFRDAKSIYVNLYVPSEVTWNRDGDEIRITQETRYPETDTTTLVVRPKKALAFDLKFRVPAWSQGTRVEVNGAPLNIPTQPGSWASVSRTWNPGDRLTIRIPMRLAFAPIDAQHPRRAALRYGPVVLVRRHASDLIVSGNQPSGWLRPSNEALEFQAEKQPREGFVPFCKIGQGESYNMYFDLVS